MVRGCVASTNAKGSTLGGLLVEGTDLVNLFQPRNDPQKQRVDVFQLLLSWSSEFVKDELHLRENVCIAKRRAITSTHRK
jgi:hypothetical protein